MKKLIGLILCFTVICLCAWAAAASSGTCGENLTWTLNDEGLLTISGTGEMDNYSSPDYGPWDHSVKTVIIENGATSIGEYAFLNCTDLTSVSIPDSVTRIGNSAFGWCKNLSDITIPDSVTSIGNGTFEFCSSLKDLTLPSGITSIEESTFTYSGLESIVIPTGVTSIGREAFYKSHLKSITIPSGVTSIGDAALVTERDLSAINVDPGNPVYTSVDGVLFNKEKTTIIKCPSGASGTYTIPDGVTTIGDDAFAFCQSLTCIEIPSSVTHIDDGAFWTCYYLTDITIPSSVTSIGESAFNSCNNLKSIAIPSGITVIGDYTFSWCKSLTSITIPVSVTSIGDSAFEYCDSLTDVYFSGKSEDREQISIGYCNAPLLNAEWHFDFSPEPEPEPEPEKIPVTKIKLNKTKADLSITLSKKGTVTLKATVSPAKATNKAVTWKSSNTKVAKVSSKGKVTAVGYGTCTITCTAKDSSKKKATCKVTVTVDEVKDLDLKYSLNHEKKTATVTGPLETTIRQATVASTVKANGKTYKVTAIKAKAFKGMKKLVTFNTGKNLKTIGASAFEGCTKLDTIGVQSKDITKIGTGAFKNIGKNVKLYMSQDLVKTYVKKLVKLLTDGGIKKITQIFE